MNNDSLKLFIEIISLSTCLWMIFGLYTSYRIERFIVRRYQNETELGQTRYFKELVPFAKTLPDFFSSVIYSFHLLIFVWGWKIVAKIKYKKKNITYFDDIDKSDQVTSHFSKKEIRRVKSFAITGVITLFHALAILISIIMHPTAFN